MVLPSRSNIMELLHGTDRRSIGRSDQLAEAVCKNPELFSPHIRGLWSEHPVVRMRAADAAEKVTRRRPELLLPYQRELLALMAEAKQAELRWHLAVMVPRLPLKSKDRHIVTDLLNHYLEDRSSWVKTYALQGLADLAQDDPTLRPSVRETLRQAASNGTPAMKARSRKLLLYLESL